MLHRLLSPSQVVVLEKVPIKGPWQCAACGEPLDAHALERLLNLLDDDPRILWVRFVEAGETPFDSAASSVLLTRHAAAYCGRCAPDVALCKDCGCTQEASCPEGCEWVGDDLCSACQEDAPDE